MKKLLIIPVITLISIFYALESFAQKGAPFMAFTMSKSRDKMKDASGAFPEFGKDSKVNWLCAVYTKMDNETAVINVLDAKTKKIMKFFMYEHTDSGEEGETKFISFTGGKDFMDRLCTLKFVSPKSADNLRSAAWIKLDVIYDDEIREFDLKMM